MPFPPLLWLYDTTSIGSLDSGLRLTFTSTVKGHAGAPLAPMPDLVLFHNKSFYRFCGVLVGYEMHYGRADPN